MKELTILMPCLNEAETLPQCIGRARLLLEKNGIDGEILVSDNGSTDGSQKIARSLGARIVDCPVRGYGAALQCGIENAEGRFILMGDSDDSYHFDEALPMIEKLREGADVCMGTRLKGRIMPDAMPFLNKFVGNPVLTMIGKLFFKSTVSDFHCGMRAFKRDKIAGLNLMTTGMEWATEMVIKSRLAGLRITEVPITLYKDGRNRPPHLRRWRDGWRHLRFMLLFSPRWLFLLPGIVLFLTGSIMGGILMGGPITAGNVRFDTNTMLMCAMAVLLGSQLIIFAVFVKIFAVSEGLLPKDHRLDRFSGVFRLEHGLMLGLIFSFIGLGLILSAVWYWKIHQFGFISYPDSLRITIPGMTILTLGVEIIFASFFLSILTLKRKRRM